MNAKSFSIAAPLVAMLGGCAGTGATLGSGVGDRFLEHPPFYAGAALPGLDTGVALGYFPVAYQAGASGPALFDPDRSELKPLLDEMTAYLADSGLGPRLIEAEALPPGSRHQPPDVRFGCVADMMDDGDCAEREGAPGRGSQPMHLAVGRPSPDWVTWSDSLMAAAGVDRALVLTVEVGQYWIQQRGFRGTKEVELGTGYTVRFPWLTSLEGPVSVLQLTGALVGRDGKAVRIGAEGLLARRTSLTVSALGGQSLVTDDEVRGLRDERREDLAGRPLVWQTALRSLVEQLTGRSLPVIRTQQF